MLRVLFFCFWAVLCTQSFAQEGEGSPGRVQEVASRADSLKAPALPDSLQWMQDQSAKLDSARQILEAKIDSLQRLGQPVEGLSRQLDSLNQVAYTLNPIPKAEERLTHLQEKAQAKVDQTVQRAEEKIHSLTGEKLPKGEIETPNLPQTDLPLQSPELAPGLSKEVPGLSADIPEINAPTEWKEIQAKSQTIKSTTGEWEEKTGAVKEIAQQTEGYKEDLGALKEGKVEEVKAVPETVENTLKNREEIRTLQEQTTGHEGMKQLEEAKKMGDEDYVKEQAVEKAKSVAVDHFAGHQDKLKLAMDKMAEYKKKYSSVQSIKDLPKRPPNPMKDKPFVERLTPGINLQVIRRGDNVSVDFAPYIGYRFSGRISAGLSGSYRTTWQGGENSLNLFPTVYGWRAYGRCKLVKGIFVHGEWEWMRTDVVNPFASNGVDQIMRTWVPGLYLGVGKDYRIAKKWRGNIQFLHNFHYEHFVSPYPTRTSVRVGMEMKWKKKKE